MGWTCPRCRADYAEPRERCDADGWRLVENLTGRIIGGRYHIDKLIGVGGMKSAVWRAMQQPTGRPVAIKVLPATSVEEAQRFERGARIASNLNHPHITTVHDYGTTHDGAFYLVMELLEGQTLQNLLKHSSASLIDTLVIVDQILRALEHAHANQVVHRDLKPANLFLTRKNDDIYFTKILDFGLAKLATGDADADSDADEDARPVKPEPLDLHNDVTQAQRICGTPEYMAPEQILGAPLDRRTDLYALGVILYRMLSGQLPFRARVRHELYQQHLAQAPPPFTPAQNVPEPVARVVMKALAKRPADRFADAAEMRVALREANRAIAGELGHAYTGLFPTDASAVKPTTPSALAEVAPRSRRGLWIALGAVVVAGGVVLALQLGDDAPRTAGATPPRERAASVERTAATPSSPAAAAPRAEPRPSPAVVEAAPAKPSVAVATPSAPTPSAPAPKEVPAQPAPAVGTIVLSTVPSGVEIWIDERLVGTTPTRLVLPQGRRRCGSRATRCARPRCRWRWWRGRRPTSACG
ncbi:MAG: protein kinase [Myxococcota bacterium]